MDNNIIDKLKMKLEIYPDQVSEYKGRYAEGGYWDSEAECIEINVRSHNEGNANEKLAFIVKACNNYDSLLEALKELYNALYNDTTVDLSGQKKALKKAKEAIKKAEQ